MRTDPAIHRRRPCRRGSTLIELMVVVTMTGILATLAVPSFRRAVEQTKVDQAAATLRTIWAAERFYKVADGPDGGGYAVDDGAESAMEKLHRRDLIERENLDTEAFAFQVVGSAETFAAAATRRGGTWEGRLEIDGLGRITGDIHPRGLDQMAIPDSEKQRLRIRPAPILRGSEASSEEGL